MNLRDITSPRWGYLIWFDQILGPHGGDFDQKFFWKVKCPTYSLGPPRLGLNIDRCIQITWSKSREKLKARNILGAQREDPDSDPGFILSLSQSDHVS